MIRVEKYGNVYYEQGKCPACSSEQDKGGRLQAHKRTNYYLKCDRCKYTIHSTKALQKKENYAMKLHKKRSGIVRE